MSSSSSAFARSIKASAESCSPQGLVEDMTVLAAVNEMWWHLSAPPAASCETMIMNDARSGSYIACTHAGFFPKGGRASDVLRGMLREEGSPQRLQSDHDHKNEELEGRVDASRHGSS